MIFTYHKKILTMQCLSKPTDKDLVFIKQTYKEQIEALELFFPIIEEAVSKGFKKEALSFGGGTALAIYYFKHRLSFDIDLFVNNVQYFNFLSPKYYIDDNPKIIPTSIPR